MELSALIVVIMSDAMIDISQMTDEQLRIAIAEELGWTNLRWRNTSGPDLTGGLTGNTPEIKAGHLVPNYPGDNNAAMADLVPGDKDFMLFHDKTDNTWEALSGMAVRGGRCNTSARAICQLWLTVRSNNAK